MLANVGLLRPLDAQYVPPGMEADQRRELISRVLHFRMTQVDSAFSVAACQMWKAFDRDEAYEAAFSKSIRKRIAGPLQEECPTSRLELDSSGGPWWILRRIDTIVSDGHWVVTARIVRSSGEVWFEVYRVVEQKSRRGSIPFIAISMTEAWRSLHHFLPGIPRDSLEPGTPRDSSPGY